MGLTPILLAAGMACAQPIALSWDTVDLITYSINEDTGVLHVRWDHSGYRPELRYYEWHLDDLEGARTACPDATNDQHCLKAPGGTPGVDIRLDSAERTRAGTVVFSVRPTYQRYDHRTGELLRTGSPPWQSVRINLPPTSAGVR